MRTLQFFNPVTTWKILCSKPPLSIKENPEYQSWQKEVRKAGWASFILVMVIGLVLITLFSYLLPPTTISTFNLDSSNPNHILVIKAQSTEECFSIALQRDSQLIQTPVECD